MYAIMMMMKVVSDGNLFFAWVYDYDCLWVLQDQLYAIIIIMIMKVVVAVTCLNEYTGYAHEICQMNFMYEIYVWNDDDESGSGGDLFFISEYHYKCLWDLSDQLYVKKIMVMMRVEVVVTCFSLEYIILSALSYLSDQLYV